MKDNTVTAKTSDKTENDVTSLFPDDQEFNNILVTGEAGSKINQEIFEKPDVSQDVLQKSPEEPISDEAKLVSVEMFKRKYQLKSDNPDLVKLLADQINKEADKVLDINPGFDEGQMDWAVQVSFRLCLALYHSHKKYIELSNNVNKTVDLLNTLLDDQAKEQK